MRIVNSLVVAGALVAALPTLAHAQWYVSGDVGASINQKSKVSGNGTDYNTSYDTGVTGLVAGGYSFGAPKVELELGYRSNDVDKVASANASGSVGQFSTMVNGLYDFNPEGVWHPIFGIGIGTGNVDAHGISVSGSPSYSGSSWQFAYQGIAALGYDLTKNLQAKLDYRYFSTTDADFNINGTGLKGDYHNHSVLLGLTYKFNAPAPAPVAPPPPPPEVVHAAPPPPPPAPVVAPEPLKNFIVFFDFDKASITAQAEAILEQAAATAKKGHAVHIELTGHTDLAGTVDYNNKLSLRRAEAVKAALVKLGLPATEIDVVGKGKSDPLVPTKDGVRQPQNRRVEILLQ